MDKGAIVWRSSQDLSPVSHATHRAISVFLRMHAHTQGLRARQHRPEGAPSEVFSLRSERFDAESDASSEYGGRRPGYASSDTGSHGNDRKQKQKQQQYHTNYTDSSANPIVPNANAIAASKYPMLKTDQTVPKKVSDTDEDNIDTACCAPCKTM